MSIQDPWAACHFSEGENATNPHGSMISWLYNGIAFSGEGVMHRKGLNSILLPH